MFNYNLPEVPETYVHRIGRTGRAGKGGVAVAIQDELNISPVMLGVGEGKDDLLPFDVQQYVESIL